MSFNKKKSLIKILVLMTCLELAGCVPEGGLTPRVIEGEWNLVEINGQNYSYNDFTFEFEEDGDFEFCYEGECYSGEWEWNSDKTELDIDYTDGFGDTYFTEFEVDVLDNEVLEGTWNIDGYSVNLEFERD